MSRKTCVSPVGQAAWAKLFEPEEGYEKDDPRCWSVFLLLDPTEKETIDFVAQLEALFKEINGANAKVAKHGWPFAEELDKNDSPTGLYQFRFKRNETTRRGQLVSPPTVIDAKRNVWPAGTLIGNGSLVKVAFSPWGWTGRRSGGMGLSLNLEAVQVLSLVEYERTNPLEVFAEEEGFTIESPVTSDASESQPSLAATLQARALADEDVPF